MNVSDTPGRNDPCGCGSGRKYKRCCLHRVRDSGNPAGSQPDDDERMPDAITDIFASVRSSFDGKQFTSEAEVKGLMASVMDQQQSRRIDDFQGLRSVDMHALLHAPFDSPGLVEIVPLLEVDPSAPALALFDGLCDAIGEKGLVATQTGNLPRALCRELFDAGLLPDAIDPFGSMRTPIRSESDFPELESLRHTAQMGGLITRRGRRFMQTVKLQQARRRAGNRAVYPILLRARAEKFNWSWGDHYDELFIVQQSWLFVVFLLQRLVTGDTPSDVLEQAFIRAFPMALEETSGTTDRERRQRVAMTVRTRAILRFAAFFGLVEATRTGDGDPLGEALILAPTPLLHAAARFGQTASPR